MSEEKKFTLSLCLVFSLLLLLCLLPANILADPIYFDGDEEGFNTRTQDYAWQVKFREWFVGEQLKDQVPGAVFTPGWGDDDDYPRLHVLESVDGGYPFLRPSWCSC